MATLWQNIQYKILRSGSKLTTLIWINILVYLLINVTATIERLFIQTNYITLYTNKFFNLSAFLPNLLRSFWSPFTYMFMHHGIFHMLFNMLWFYWFGQIFEEYLGNKRIFGLYLLGGFAGAFLFIVGLNSIPAFVSAHTAASDGIVGASTAVMTIVVATATLLPNYTLSFILIGPVKLKWIAIFYVLVDFLGLDAYSNGEEIAHLGGALMGFVYIKQLQSGTDWISIISSWFKPRPNLKIVSTNMSQKSAGRPRQEDIDFILDKISKSGYDSLSKNEKEILFRASDNEGKK
jgi:membrane associated rhomboid family serine protease